MGKIVTPEEDAFDGQRAIFEKEAETLAGAEVINGPFGPSWGCPVKVPTPTGPKITYVAIHATCGINLHKGPRPVMACRHCTQQDEVHPVGIVFMPAGYYLCNDCFKLLERKKFNIPNEITIQCSDCVWICIQTIQKKDPALYRNLREEKKAGV